MEIGKAEWKQMNYNHSRRVNCNAANSMTQGLLLEPPVIVPKRPTILLFAGKNPTVFPAKHGLVQANNSAVHDDPSTQGTSEFDLQSVAIFRGQKGVEGLLMNTTEYKQQRSVQWELSPSGWS